MPSTHFSSTTASDEKNNSTESHTSSTSSSTKDATPGPLATTSLSSSSGSSASSLSSTSSSSSASSSSSSASSSSSSSSLADSKPSDDDISPDLLISEEEAVDALKKHTAAFANPSGDEITTDSFNQVLVDNGIEKERAAKTAKSFMNGVRAGLFFRHGICPFKAVTPTSAAKLLHSERDSGIYKYNGSVDLNNWERMIRACSVKNLAGERIIYKSTIDKYLSDRYAASKQCDLFGIAEGANKEEWEFAFEMIGDKDKTEIKVTALRQFILDTHKAFQDKKNEKDTQEQALSSLRDPR